MLNAKLLQRVAVWVAVAGFCMPQAVLADTVTPEQKAPVVEDVALHNGGMLVGQVVDAQGAPMAKVQVALRSGDRQLGMNTTNEQGHFGFRGLNNGVYQVTAAKGQGTYRLWTEKTAPPSAHPGALIVSGNDTVRGQQGAQRLRCLLANPWVIAGIIATAVAVPVALHNSGSQSP